MVARSVLFIAGCLLSYCPGDGRSQDFCVAVSEYSGHGEAVPITCMDLLPAASSVTLYSFSPSGLIARSPATDGGSSAL